MLKRKDLLSLNEVAKQIGVTRETVCIWRKDESLGFPAPARPGRKLYFRKRDVEKFEDSYVGRLRLSRNVINRLPEGNEITSQFYDYEELVATLRDRRKEMGLSQADLEAKAGFQVGYVSKLEKPFEQYGRVAGPAILEKWLTVLKIGLVARDIG